MRQENNMDLLRIQNAVALEGFKLRLTLTNGLVVKRDLSDVLAGPIFDPIRADPALFQRVRVEEGTVVWPNGADLCPDVLIWNGAPPKEDTAPPTQLRLRKPVSV
jgi:hypothetical protein